MYTFVKHQFVLHLPASEKISPAGVAPACNMQNPGICKSNEVEASMHELVHGEKERDASPVLHTNEQTMTHLRFLAFECVTLRASPARSRACRAAAITASRNQQILTRFNSSYHTQRAGTPSTALRRFATPSQQISFQQTWWRTVMKWIRKRLHGCVISQQNKNISYADAKVVFWCKVGMKNLKLLILYVDQILLANGFHKLYLIRKQYLPSQF